MQVRPLFRRLAAQFIDAFALIALAAICFSGTSYSPLQKQGDQTTLYPFPLIPLASMLEISFSEMPRAGEPQSLWVHFVEWASSPSDLPQHPRFTLPMSWSDGGLTTISYQVNWSLGLAILWLLYSTLCIGTWGQTAGKRLMRVRVVRASGEPVGHVRSLVRTLAYIPGVVVLFYVLWLVVAPGGRWWYDRLADTRVVDA